MLSIRFVYLVATLTVVVVQSYPVLDGASELRLAHQASLFGLTDEEENDSDYLASITQVKQTTILAVVAENDYNYQLDYNHGDYGLETDEEVSEEMGLPKLRHQPDVRLEKVQPSIDKSLE